MTIQRDATQSSLFIILQVHSTCFGMSTTPIIRSTQNCNYSLRYWSYVLCSYLPPMWSSLATLEGGSCKQNMTNIGCCSYSFVYSWWWVWLTTKHVEWTCRIINRLLCVASRCTIINIDPWHIFLPRQIKLHGSTKHLAKLYFSTVESHWI